MGSNRPELSIFNLITSTLLAIILRHFLICCDLILPYAILSQRILGKLQIPLLVQPQGYCSHEIQKIAPSHTLIHGNKKIHGVAS